MANVAKLIKYSGRVQGVGFRYTAQRVALRCELYGYVRNLPDGGVELFIQGRAEDVKECMMDLSETFGANIHESKAIDAQWNTNYDGFSITY